MRIIDLDYVDRYHASPVLSLLTECDSEFVPPLSSCSSTTQSGFSNAAASSNVNGVLAYFAELCDQPIMMAYDGDSLIGFLSYIPGRRLDFIVETTTYISTICVAHTQRRLGIASSLYDHIELVASPGIISLRTWSTNEGHRMLLERRGYEMVKRIPNDRGDGVDTLYFAKCV